MYTVSALWNSLMANPKHIFDYRVVIGEAGRLITRYGDVITFGGSAILTGQSGADGGYSDSMLRSILIQYRAFSEDHPGVGACLAAELDLEMMRPAGTIPRMALVRPYVRVVVPEVNQSEWIPQGVFFIDTREYSRNDDGLNIMTIHCYDKMLMTEQDYPDVDHEWPCIDIDVVREIADEIGVEVDPRTVSLMTRQYLISAPIGYSMREVLCNIAAMYGGNFVMNYDGELLLVPIYSMPAETNYLVNNLGYAITFGGDRILV